MTGDRSAALQTATRTLRPDRLTLDARQRLSSLFTVLTRVKRRLWRQRSVVRGVRVAALGALFAAAVIIFTRAAVISAAEDAAVAWAAAALAGSGVLWIGLHRTRWYAAARTLDLRAQGFDRATTALHLAVRDDAPAWTAVQAQSATTWATTVDVAAALPWRRPQGLPLLAVASVGLLAAMLLPLRWLAPAGEGGVASGVTALLPPAPLGFAAAADLLSADALTLLRDDVEMLIGITQQVDDDATKRWLQRVTKVLRKVEQGELDKRTALQELAKLEKDRPGATTEKSADKDGAAKDPAAKDSAAAQLGDAKNPALKKTAESAAQSSEQERQRDRAVTNRVANALTAALKDAPDSALRSALKQAASKKDIGLMGKMLEKLAEHAQKNMNDKELSKWMKVAEKFAKNLGDQRVPKRFAALERRVRRLQARRKQQGGLGQTDRRRLASNRRQLQQLRKQHGDVQGAKYQLKRLQKEARKAASELRRTRQQAGRLQRKRGKRAQRELRRQQARKQMKRSLRRHMRRAAGEMRRQSGQQRSRQAQRIGQRRLRDLRQALRRSGRKNRGRRDFERRARKRMAQQKGQQKTKRPGEGKRRSPGQDRKSQRRAAAERRAKQRAKQRAAQKAREMRGSAGNREKNRPNKVARKFRLGEGDMPDRTRMRMMRQGGGRGQQGGPGQQSGHTGRGGKSGTKSGRGGKGMGKDAGQPLTGRRTGMAVARTERVKGVHGEGPSIQKVFTEAAKRGFARRGWREVYAEYSEVAEEMMESEGLPVGRKALVKRYFELIRPRN